MGRETEWGHEDRQYLRRDGGNEMLGPLQLAGLPTAPNHATSKAYIDNLVATLNTLTPAQIAALIAVLTTPGGTIDARIAAAVAAYLPIDGSVAMTGDLTLSGLPTLPAHAANKQYVDALPVGLSTYDAVVAAAGGDYTSVAAACAGEAAGARIFVKAGTYNEAGSVTMLDGQMLIGENPEDTIIDFGGGNFKITSAGGMTNLAVKDLTVQGSIADFTVELVGNYARVENCRIIGTVNAFTGVSLTGDHSVLENCFITDFTKPNLYCASITGNYCKAIGNTFTSSSRGLVAGTIGCHVIGNSFVALASVQIILEQRAICIGNQFYGGSPLYINNVQIMITGNYIYGGGASPGIEWLAGHDYVTITGNIFYQSRVFNTLVAVEYVTVSGNVFRDGTGVTTDGKHWSITGNTFIGNARIYFTANASDNIATGNDLTAAALGITDIGFANEAMHNSGVPTIMDKDFANMVNTSGGGLVAGDVVVFKSVAAGNEVDTTVALGDDAVFGMVDENIANTASGHVQTRGKTTKLKVNGTVAIGIGDMLSTNNVAGIARKAAAGHTAFAVALEAYAGADNLGVIDAQLVCCRKV